MRYIFTILTTAITRFEEMVSTLWGFIFACCVAAFNFLCGYKVALLVVFVAVMFDMCWGIAAAKKQGRFALSELMGHTFKKISAYGTALVMTMLVENLAFGSHQITSSDGANTRFIVDIVASAIAAVESWSICGNILIVNPNAKFFRLIKSPLIGEIARKLKMTEDEVKEIFRNEKEEK